MTEEHRSGSFIANACLLFERGIACIHHSEARGHILEDRLWVFCYSHNNKH